MISLPALLAATFFVSFCLTGLVMRFARARGMIDLPGDRHSHTIPTPRGGGAGLIIALLLASLPWTQQWPSMPFWLHCVLPGFLLLGLVGWRDDRKSLSARLRFSVQLLVSSYLLWCFYSAGTDLGWFAALAALFFLLWMTNLYNFMDGSNGMAGSQGVFAGVMLAWLFDRAGNIQAMMLSLLFAAACLGFLPWNLGRARVFMGDVASGSLGFGFAALLVYGVLSGELLPAVAWMVMLVFLVDASLTLLGRVLVGEQWYNPHKQHLYQRLIARGWSHGSVLTVFQLINLVIVVPAIVVAVNRPELAWFVAIFASLALSLAWLLARKKLGALA